MEQLSIWRPVPGMFVLTSLDEHKRLKVEGATQFSIQQKHAKTTNFLCFCHFLSLVLELIEIYFLFNFLHEGNGLI